tara:strand:+ start:1335 stop:2321 length:987 start_codon:yes stop_codon:yes gene_type:complete
MNWEKLKNKINDSSNILLSTHKNPDGDGLGSELAMYYYLKSINKNVSIINISSMASRYNFMDPENIVKTYTPELSVDCFDLVIVFDLGDYKRLGVLGDNILDNNIDTINIDHHVPRDNDFYCLSIVNIEAPSTTYMIWKYFEYLNLNNNPLADNIAIPLYAGLLNDTGSFRYSAVNSDTHNMASHLLESNVNPNKIFQYIYENRTKGKINLLSAMISSLQFEQDGKVGYAIIDRNMFADSKASIDDADGLADFIRSIDGVEISFCITSLENTKISFRSRGEYTVNDIAQIFGGGGHYFASGCEIQESEITSSIEKILFELNRKINNGN